MKLPLCGNDDKDSLKCFLDIVSEAKRQIKELPCTKVQYRVHVNNWQGGTSETSTTIHMNFAKPYHVTVHEEYLIYDLVAMVGAIGGTLGLCTGISFREILLLLFICLREILKCIHKVKHRNHVSPFNSDRRHPEVLGELQDTAGTKHEKVNASVQKQLEKCMTRIRHLEENMILKGVGNH